MRQFISRSLTKTNGKGLVGVSLLVKDRNGVWMGGAGKADIASDIDVHPCQQFLIASISKVFTSAAVFRYVDRGVLSLEDPISKLLDQKVVDKVDNAEEAQIKHLLAHTSGIADFYTAQFELDRVNRERNGWTKEEVLAYIYGKSANFPVGETYRYSNTNFLLLSMILEKASGKSFEQVYQDEVFNPLQLTSAYYSETHPIPEGCVKGYADIYDNGQLAETRFVYEDELGIGGDGGVAINVYDQAQFLERLAKGELISQSSLDQMFNWFDLPEDWHWETFGQTENGYGIEKFNTPYGWAIGHTGGIDGFSTYAFYFQEADMTYVMFTNSVSAYPAEAAIYEAVLEKMFE